MNIKIINNELIIRIPIRKIEQTVVGKGVRLTARESDVFNMMLQGKNAKDVAQELNLSPRTGKFHICNIIKKIRTLKMELQLLDNQYRTEWRTPD